MAVIYGSIGYDTINGTAEADTIYGGSTDQPSSDLHDDTLNGLGGNDVLYGFEDIDHLNGGEGNDTLIGGDDGDILDGGVGADTMYGGDTTPRTGPGADTTGDDIYIVDNPGDMVIELSPKTYDRVLASIDYTLPANVEYLALTGTAIRGIGNSLDNYLQGNAEDNQLYGLDGSDFLDGGAGMDHMEGGNGNDYYTVDNPGDVIFDTDGVDSVHAFLDWTLGDGLEDLQIGLSLGSPGPAKATGNALDNHLYGNASDNRLDGAGGDDIMAGFGGNDTYIVEGVGDVVSEQQGQGTDTVLASISWVLAKDVENLTLTGGAATNGTGNALANVLIGNDAANQLLGAAGDDRLEGGGGNDFLNGGGGADTMLGGSGNDIYLVDDIGDQVSEAGGSGIDLVRTSINYTLGDGLENLAMRTGGLSGTGNAMANSLRGSDGSDTLRGLDGNDSLVGLAGNDALSGGAGNDRLAGGLGSDRMTGGDGADRFVIAMGDGRDTIADFDPNSGDVVELRGYGPTLDSFAELSALFQQKGTSVIVDIAPGDRLTFSDMIVGSFHANDFMFG